MKKFIKLENIENKEYRLIVFQKVDDKLSVNDILSSENLDILWKAFRKRHQKVEGVIKGYTEEIETTPANLREVMEEHSKYVHD